MNYVASFLNDEPGTQHRLGEAIFVMGKGMSMDIHADTLSAATDLALLNKPDGYHLHDVELKGNGR